MACNAGKTPLFRVIAQRGFAASASPRPVGQIAAVQSAVLGNKTVVATAPSSVPAARVSVIFCAGSRHESYDSLGAAHMLRIASGLSTKERSGFSIARNIAQLGARISCTTDRECVKYTIETNGTHLEDAIRYLEDIIQPAFKPWELSDDLPRVRNQAKSVAPQERAIELLHKAAFRTGLGNSIYIPKHQIGRLSPETLQHYVSSNFTSDRCAVVGVGVDHNSLSGFAQSLNLPVGSDKHHASSKYHGGDARKDTAGQLAHVAVGAPGGSILPQEQLAFEVLKYALGGTPVVSYGGNTGIFGKTLGSAIGGDAVANIKPINANYSDTGLFGFVVSADAQNIGKAVEALAKALKAAAVSGEDVSRAKAMLKTAITEAYCNDSALLSVLSSQAALTRQVQSVDATLSAVDGITLDAVKKAAEKITSAKLSVGAVGNLGNVPYSTDLA